MPVYLYNYLFVYVYCIYPSITLRLYGICLSILSVAIRKNMQYLSLSIYLSIYIPIYLSSQVITYFAFVGSSAPAKKATGKEDPNAKKKASLEDQVHKFML